MQRPFFESSSSPCLVRRHHRSMYDWMFLISLYRRFFEVNLEGLQWGVSGRNSHQVPRKSWERREGGYDITPDWNIAWSRYHAWWSRGARISKERQVISKRCTSQFLTCPCTADQRKILLSNLSSLSYIEKHRKERKKRHAGTGTWLNNTSEFQAWMAGGSNCLWCHGIRTYQLTLHWVYDARSQLTML